METTKDKDLIPNTRPDNPVLTFADKFSKFKSRFMVVLWMVIVIFFINYTYNFLSSIYWITRDQESFYTITVIEDNAYYTRVSEKPATWIPLNKISKRIQQAIVSSEDGKFYDHPGYDLEQLRDAIYDSFVLKKKMRGASTITQQLVKNLYLNQDRTFGRKIREFVLALIIERYADKQKILEMYLNVIEYGKGLYGIDAAAKYYFNKSPSNLNAREAAFLAMLLPSPKKYSKSFKNKKLTRFANRSLASILLKMRNNGYIGQEEYETHLYSRFAWEKEPAIEENTEIIKTESEEEFEEGSGEL